MRTDSKGIYEIAVHSINNQINNKLDKTQNAAASPITGIKYAQNDVRGVIPAKLTNHQKY